MNIVVLTALGVGGATVAGAVIGFVFKGISHRFGDAVLSFAAGIMLAAAILGLIVPSVESGGGSALLVAIAGIFCGALCMELLGRLVKQIKPLSNTDSSVVLFVAAIAIHNLPEGIAAGVGFGAGNTSDALMIAGGIALQNIPEGMVIISPMLSTGISAKRTFLCALATGLIEVVGTFMGYFAITLATAILPFALAFAGGTMLFIICGEMIPQTCCKESSSLPTYSLLAGVCLMLVFDVLMR